MDIQEQIDSLRRDNLTRNRQIADTLEKLNAVYTIAKHIHDVGESLDDHRKLGEALAALEE